MNLKHLKEPFVICLIGPPLVGKSTWIRKNFPDGNLTVISMDQIIMDLDGGEDYNVAYKSVNQKELKASFHQQMIQAAKNDENVIIDMTHLVRKRRRTNLAYFPKHYYKLGIIFPIPTDEEIERRNAVRTKEEKKHIGMDIYKMMVGQYQPVSKAEEGFNKIISL